MAPFSQHGNVARKLAFKGCTECFRHFAHELKCVTVVCTGASSACLSAIFALPVSASYSQSLLCKTESINNNYLTRTAGLHDILGLEKA